MRSTNCSYMLILALPLLLASCDGGESATDGAIDANDAAHTDAGDGGVKDGGPVDASLFVEGCPVKGKASAGKIANANLRALGPDALGVNEDYLLMNEKAAFIIQGPGHPVNTYYYYPGILIDAVAVDGCQQASQERFQELWLLMGRLNASDFLASTLRTFRGDSVEILNDGKDGKTAKVRVKGADDIFWLLELQLIGEAFNSGKPKAMSQPMGLEIWVDYSLAPGSGVLQVDLTFINKDAVAQSLMCGTAIQFGNSIYPRYWAQSVLSLGGYNIDQGLPWNVAAGGDGAWAFSMKSAFMGTMTISGVTAFVDVNQVASPMQLSPSGTTGDRQKVTYFMSVGGTDSNSATRNLQAVNPEPIPGMKYQLAPFNGKVTETGTGNPLEKVLVELQAQDSKGKWRPMDSFYTAKDGSFSGEIASFIDTVMQYRLSASSDGRATVVSDVFNVPGTAEMNLSMDRPGSIHLNILDGSGKGLPAKVVLWKGGQVAQRIFSLTGADTFPVIPGTYDVSVTRGYEYTSYQGTLTVDAGTPANLSVTLVRSVDSSGFLSMDGHIHSGFSADNKISVPDRIATAAGEGLEVAVSTDHEFIDSWQWGIDKTGLGDWVATITGQEVTAPLPEHTNIYGVTPDFSLDARGGYVKWFGMDIAQIYNAETLRGAKLRQLNHPRNGCNYMCKIRYDRITGLPLMTDPTKLGFKADASLWSWNFDALEFQNGPQWIFLDKSNPDSSGSFDDWMSFLNLGHIITAVGNSDAHDYEIPGSPRNFFASATDNPSEFLEEYLVKAVKEGRVLVSNGAFARVKVNGTAGMGDIVTDSDGEIDLNVHIEAPPEIDVAYFKVYVNCDQVLNVAATAPDAVVKYDGALKVPVSKDSHVVVLGFGKKAMPRGLSQYNPAQVPRFTANAVYVDFDGNGKFDPPGGKTCTYDLDPP